MPVPDSTFGVNGEVSLANFRFSNMRIDTEGKIVVTGRRTGLITNSLVTWRLSRSGTPDSSYGTYGETFRDLPGSCGNPGILSDGRVVVSDRFVALSTSGIRCFKGQEPDSSFGLNGLTAFWGQNDVAYTGCYIDSNDRIFFPGVQLVFSSETTIFLACGSQGDTLSQYPTGYGRAHSHGTTDEQSLSAMTMGHDNKMLFAGKGESSGSPNALFISRNNSTGSGRDMSFNNGSAVEFLNVLPSNNYEVAIAQLPDGKITCITTRALVQLLPNGQPDPDFGNDGVVSTSADTHSIDMKGFKQVADGKILAFGAKNSKIAFQRFLANGKIDSSFAVNGTFNPDVSGTAFTTRMIVRGDTVLAGNGSSLFQFVMRNSPVLGTTDNQWLQSPLLYPNPARTSLFLSSQCRLKNELLLWNTIGQAYKRQIRNGFADVSDLQPGLYLYRLKGESGALFYGKVLVGD